MDWKREIAIAHLVKQKVAEVDVAGLWIHPFPEVAASEGELSALEMKLGVPIDREIREFLINVNGWKSFFHAIDVFGVDDFLGGSRRIRAEELMQSLEPLEELCGYNKSQLAPFAVSMDDIDIFVIASADNRESGEVIWFAGGLVDRFMSFSEWFLAMVDYNRREYQRLKDRNGLI